MSGNSRDGYELVVAVFKTLKTKHKLRRMWCKQFRRRSAVFAALGGDCGLEGNINRIPKGSSCPIGISASLAQTRRLVPYSIGISPSMAQTRRLVPYPIGISPSMAQTRRLVPYSIGISPSMAQTRWLVPYPIGISPSMAQGRVSQRFFTGRCATVVGVWI